MGVRILTDYYNDSAVLYDSVTDFTLGRVIRSRDDHALDAHDNAELFLGWLRDQHGIRDVRVLKPEELDNYQTLWTTQATVGCCHICGDYFTLTSDRRIPEEYCSTDCWDDGIAEAAEAAGEGDDRQPDLRKA